MDPKLHVKENIQQPCCFGCSIRIDEVVLRTPAALCPVCCIDPGWGLSPQVSGRSDALAKGSSSKETSEAKVSSPPPPPYLRLSLQISLSSSPSVHYSHFLSLPLYTSRYVVSHPLFLCQPLSFFSSPFSLTLCLSILLSFSSKVRYISSKLFISPTSVCRFKYCGFTVFFYCHISLFTYTHSSLVIPHSLHGLTDGQLSKGDV